MAKTKGGGPRVVVDWGQTTVKVKGKKVSKKLSSRVLKSTADLFKLKVSKVGGASVKSIKVTGSSTKRLVISAPRMTIGKRKLYASVDGRTWHAIPVPTGVSLAKAFVVLQKAGAAFSIKWQGGTPSIIGKVPKKDTKSNAKSAKETK